MKGKPANALEWPHPHYHYAINKIKWTSIHLIFQSMHYCSKIHQKAQWKEHIISGFAWNLWFIANDLWIFSQFFEIKCIYWWLFPIFFWYFFFTFCLKSLVYCQFFGLLGRNFFQPPFAELQTQFSNFLRISRLLVWNFCFIANFSNSSLRYPNFCDFCCSGPFFSTLMGWMRQFYYFNLLVSLKQTNNCVL